MITPSPVINHQWFSPSRESFALYRKLELILPPVRYYSPVRHNVTQAL
ncbi:hypothetical protein [Escherichia phage BI-EHEC]|nr:hypothetical protein [Escherichia phage BI-EHEC]